MKIECPNCYESDEKAILRTEVVCCGMCGHYYEVYVDNDRDIISSVIVEQPPIEPNGVELRSILRDIVSSGLLVDSEYSRSILRRIKLAIGEV